jgi:fibronectin-binding autotransporter adhesin
MSDNQVWFRRRARVDATAPRGGRRGRPRLRARPEILLLEDRRLMATFLVTDPSDSLTGGVPTPNTLRWAVDQANLATQPDDASVIDFSLGGGPTTITLTQGPLEISNTTGPISIVGTSAQDLTISGGGTSGVFQVDKGASATLSNLTISGGVTTGDGGGLLNEGMTTLSDVVVTGNEAAGDGGGIENAGSL